MDPKEIKYLAEAFINSTRNRIGFPNVEMEELATKRYETCLECSTRTGTKCDKAKGGCGCPLHLRTRSSKGCPLKKW